MFVSFILDETGSMQAVKGATIRGFNEYVGELQRHEDVDEIRFTLTKFNSARVEIVHDSVPMGAVHLLTAESYQPANLTPLYDAIGRTIRALERKMTCPSASALVVIQTDGYENDSKEFTRAGIFSLIEEKKGGGWTFVFLGADQDAWATGQALGLDYGNVKSYSSVNTGMTFGNLAARTASYVSRGGRRTTDFWRGEGSEIEPITWED